MKYGRSVFSLLAALGAAFFVLLRYHRIGFPFFWWLLTMPLLLGGVIVLASDPFTVYRFLAYGCLAAPYFLCLLVSTRKTGGRSRTGVGNRVIGAMMLLTLVLSTVTLYPLTPLYPVSGGNPILDDNSVNSIFVVSGLQYFSSVYSSGLVVTSNRIFWQMLSLHPRLVDLGWRQISPNLDDVTTPAELRNELVVFDAGGKSGTANLAMRELTPRLRNRLGIVFSNGFFYIGLST